jgi:ribosomal protein S18 acetylase RimI-like enzyme
MVGIRKARVEEVENLLSCQAQVLESLRGMLPTHFIEYQMRWLRGSDVEDALETAIEGKNTIVLVAEDAKSIVGFAQGRVNKGGTSWLAYMGVIPAYRRRGIGRELTKSFLTESRSRGAHKVSLYTAKELKPAINLYIGLGFVRKGTTRRHNYGVDLIEYSRSLE